MGILGFHTAIQLGFMPLHGHHYGCGEFFALLPKMGHRLVKVGAKVFQDQGSQLLRSDHLSLHQVCAI